ncbi:hypothetical protein [Gimesia chilikensis]|uniref:Uncharacterized protein n=1 Tax=Gimesia chilikensis TaxID=2605989 RepID=A0A517PKZ7_9PLAN|nr:hypothetical protein [Gimesia chilikensis]QDT20053.1 hypothetical protein HG66A1_18380 [Gimesia chilikensis]
MHQIQLILHGNSSPGKKPYLFPIPGDYVHLLRTYQIHLGEHLQSLIQVDQQETPTIAVLNSNSTRDREFFRALRSDLIELTDQSEPVQASESSSDSQVALDRSNFSSDDQETLQQFIEWCAENHRTLITILFDNDFFNIT